MNLLELQGLSPNEEALIAEVFRNPAVLKYLRVLASNLAIESIQCPITFEEAPEAYLRKQIVLKAQLELLNTLAQIFQPAVNPSFEE